MIDLLNSASVDLTLGYIFNLSSLENRLSLKREEGKPFLTSIPYNPNLLVF